MSNDLKKLLESSGFELWDTGGHNLSFGKSLEDDEDGCVLICDEDGEVDFETDHVIVTINSDRYENGFVEIKIPVSYIDASFLSDVPYEALAYSSKC